jgi:hypothetical protein
LYLSNENFRNGINELLSTLWDTITPILDEILKFIGSLLESVAPLITEVLAPIVSITKPLGGIFTDILQLVKNIVSVLSPILGMIGEALNILTPILEIVHGITWVVSTVLSGAVQTVLWVLTPILAIFEAILKVVETIGEVVRALFQWDWGSLGKNLSNIWTDWKIPQLSTSLSQMQLTPSWKADGGLATKGSLFYAGEAGPELVTKTSGGGSTIMNMEQLEDAVARGFIRGAVATQGNENQQITVNVSGRSLFSILVAEAKSSGYELVKVR